MSTLYTRIHGLYAITPDEPDSARLTTMVQAAIDGGIDALQYRSKSADGALRREQALALKALTDAAGIPLIVNDDVALALSIDAAGVHVGRDDGDPAEIRRRIGGQRLLGVSCYDSLQRAIEVKDIADHVAFGSVFLSGTKPGAVRAPLTLFGEARRLGIATVAIGGIDSGNAARVLEAGADAIAVIGDVFGAQDVRGAAQRLKAVVARAPRAGASG
jgi:thiamine-phosphate pyrophosphorylase